MSENHSFNTIFAKKHGIEEAIIFNDLYYWCSVNKENNRNLFKGEDGVERYWTYNSCKAFSEIYDYITPSKIRRVLNKLVSEGLIVVGNFNKIAYDQTHWYAITEKGESEIIDCYKTIGFTLYDNSILQNEQMEDTKLSNRNDKSDKPIPDTNTDINLSTPSESVPESIPESNTVNTSKKSHPKKSDGVKKTKINKTDEELEELFKQFSQTEVNVAKTCINNFYLEKRRNDSKYARSPNQLRNWSYQLLNFAITSERGINEVAKVWNYVITDVYIMPYLESVKKFVENYEKYIQKCNTNSQRKGYQRQTLVGSEFDKAHENTVFDHKDEGGWT